MDKEVKRAMLKKFGEILLEKRIRKNLTQDQVSERAGITNTYLRDLERGNYSATWLIWLRLCSILDIDITEIQRMLMAQQAV